MGGRFLEWLLKKIDRVGIKRKLIHGDEMRYVINTLAPGNLILTLAYAEATSLLIQGEWSHASFYLSGNSIIDVRADGVRERDVLDLFPGTTALCIRRPKISQAQVEQMQYIARCYADQRVEYDYSFASGDSKLYCSEFYWTLLDAVAPGLVKLKSRMGVLTVTPQDLYESDMFDNVLEVRR